MEWNVIVSVQERGYKNARRLLGEYGRVRKTDYYNILTMAVADIAEFMEEMRALYEMQAPVVRDIGHIMPVTDRFTYQSPEEFEDKAKAVVTPWLPALAGKHFFVRMRRRGFKGRLSSQVEEQFLNEYILDTLANQGEPAAKVDFSHPQQVIAIETLGQEAGMSLWNNDQLARYPFLKLK